MFSPWLVFPLSCCGISNCCSSHQNLLPSLFSLRTYSHLSARLDLSSLSLRQWIYDQYLLFYTFHQLSAISLWHHVIFFSSLHSLALYCILTLVSLLFPIFSKQTRLQSVCHKTLTKKSLCVQKPEQRGKLGNVLNPSIKVFYVPTF